MFQLERGLAKFDCVDYHAVLGIPINAEEGAARKSYVKIARSLHPDSCTEGNKQLASQFLSKFVNPAYEKLSQPRDRAEHELLLRLLSQRVAQERNTIELQTEIARQLLQAQDANTAYKTAVQDLAAKQYQWLDQTLELTEQLSELNLAYLITKEGKRDKHPTPSVATPSATTVSTSANPKSTSPSTQNSGSLSTEIFVNQYYHRAEEFLASNNFQKAMLELRDALKLEPHNSRCHSLIGVVYLKQNQITMARVHFNQALKLDPNNAMALSGRSQLDKLDPKAKAKGSPAQKRDGGGLFGLFGGKKK